MRGRRLAHLVLAVAGLLVAIYPFTLGAHPSVTCRGVELRPGQSCAKADGSAAQSYEARAADARNATPVIVGIGLLVAVFGSGLYVADVRRERAPVAAGSS
ncbi:MAG TPA: hypothetical protein VIT41_03430 [Microlunatus sp.]